MIDDEKPIKFELGIRMGGLRGIPPNTPMRQTRPSTIGQYWNNGNSTYSKPKTHINTKFDENVVITKDVTLDLFEEDDTLKVIGEIGAFEKNDIITYIQENELVVMSKPYTKKKFETKLTLPESYDIIIKDVEIRNGVMTMILTQIPYEDVPDELQTVFNECLKSYPELDEVELKLVKSRRNSSRDTLDGANGKEGDKKVVVLFVPELLWEKWEVLKPIIHHELSHFINLENPDSVMEERADRKSLQLWEMMKKDNLVDCKVE